MRRLLLLVVALALVASPARGDTGPGSGLGGYKASSRSSGIDGIYNDGSEVNLTLPYAETDAGLGVGHALAADAYPGPVGGNPGATLKQFLGANIPPALADALGTLTYPAKAEAYNSGPTDASFPENGPIQGLSDTAHVDANAASMTAVGAYTQVGGVDSRAVSTTTLAANSITSVATSTVSDLNLGDIVHIGKIVSSATTISDGTTGQAKGSTVIAGLTVLGMAVAINGTDVTVGPTKVPFSLASTLNPLVAPLGIHLTVSPEVHLIKGARAVEHAPALLISFAPPNNGGNTFQVILGGAEAEAQATPGFSAFPLPPLPSVSGPSPSPAGAAVEATLPSAAPPSGSSSVPVPAAPVPTSGGSLVAAPPPALPTAADSKGISAGLVTVGFAVGLAGAFGLGKIPDDVLADKPPSVCPIERSEP